MSLTITLDPAQNVINLYYTPNNYAYRVEYYYDGNLDSSKTASGTMAYKRQISSYTDKNLPFYELDHVANLPLTIDTNEDSNVVKVYYKATTGTANVTFAIVNGTWQGSGTASKTVTVDLLAGAGTLSAASIPVAVPNTGYRAGSWDVDPETSANGITGNVVYTYTCMLADDLSYTLTFPVKPGTAAMLRPQHVSVCFKASGMAVTAPTISSPVRRHARSSTVRWILSRIRNGCCLCLSCRPGRIAVPQISSMPTLWKPATAMNTSGCLWTVKPRVWSSGHRNSPGAIGRLLKRAGPMRTLPPAAKLLPAKRAVDFMP